MKFHHIGLFVESLEQGVEQMSNTINIASIGERIEDSIIDVSIMFLDDSSGITYELVAPLSNNSPVNGVLKRGSGFLNHVAYTTDQFDDEVSRLRQNQNVPLGPAKAAKAFNGRRVIFFLTKLNFIIELVEEQNV